jgi:hypothetical protein
LISYGNNPMLFKEDMLNWASELEQHGY